MSAIALPKPVNVSPLIRVTRWSLLIFGIFYGMKKKVYYRNLANRRRQEMKPVIEARIVKNKIKTLESTRVAALNVAKDFGITLPPEYSKPCFGKPCEEAIKKAN